MSNQGARDPRVVASSGFVPAGSHQQPNYQQQTPSTLPAPPTAGGQNWGGGAVVAMQGGMQAAMQPAAMQGGSWGQYQQQPQGAAWHAGQHRCGRVGGVAAGAAASPAPIASWRSASASQSLFTVPIFAFVNEGGYVGAEFDISGGDIMRYRRV